MEYYFDEDEDLYYHAILTVFYNPIENIFYDQCGIRIINIFEIITPNDLFLFKHDNNNCYFRMKDEPYIICEIMVDDYGGYNGY
jgi:hypothetical protein